MTKDLALCFPDRPYINKTASSNATVKSWLNHVTRLKCAVDANPAANFTWFKDGRPILNGVNSTHDISTLTLRPNTTGDFGRYFCKAANVKGTAWYNITLKQLCKCNSLKNNRQYVLLKEELSLVLVNTGQYTVIPFLIPRIGLQ